MKRILYLCVIMTLSMNMMAQIDLNDQNWHGSLIENFDETVSYWQWHTNNFSNSNYRWKAFLGNHIDTDNLNHLYQFNNARYDSINGAMLLVSEYDTLKLIPHYQFALPTNGSTYGSIYINNKFYFSGAIEYVKNIWHPEQGRFKYGYFEIRCKLPKHRGAFPAFWLHGASTNASDPYYEEIDVFEYTWSIGDPNGYHWLFENPNPTFAGDPHVITTGIYQNLLGDTIIHDTDTYARNYPRLPYGGPDISGWHTYSCEWMPDHVYWYLDGRLVNSYFDVAHIPHHPMALKTNYAINKYALKDYSPTGQPEWKDGDTMTIDYIKVYQLECDCDTEEVIISQNELSQFIYKVKKSITLAPANGTIAIGANDKVSFRATDSFEINGPFEIQQGGEFTVIMQACPE